MHLRQSAGLIAAVFLTASCSDDPGWTFDAPVDLPVETGDVDAAPDIPDAFDAPDTMDAPDSSDPPAEDGFVDTIGRVCGSAEDCQNGVYCDGEEQCPYGFCTAGALVDCDDGINCTLDSCNEETDTCDHPTDDAACDDLNPCTDDSCDVTTDTCVNPPIDCSDGITCTLDTCDPSTGACDHTVTDEACDDLDDCTIDTCDTTTDTCSNVLIDGDGDRYPPESCGGDDCDDSDSSIHPGASEVCGDGIDQDCDGFDGDEGTCACPSHITASGTYTGTTSGSSSHDPTGCAYSSSGPEWIYVITPTSTSSVTFTTAGTGFDTVLYVKSISCTTGTEIGCNDDTYYGLDSELTVSLTGGTTYFLFLDGYDSYEYGAFTLNVTGL